MEICDREGAELEICDREGAELEICDRKGSDTEIFADILEPRHGLRPLRADTELAAMRDP